MKYFNAYLIAALCLCIVMSCTTSKRTQTITQTKTSAKKPTATKKNKLIPTYTLATIADRPYLGIGSFVDEATNLSRSFAVYELFHQNILINGTDSLYPVLVDYPFNAPYAITGMFKDKAVKIKIYKNGKKLKEITTSNDWKEIYQNVGKLLVNTSIQSKRSLSIDEGSPNKLGAKYVSSCFPGSVEVDAPYSKIVDTFKHYVNLHFEPGNDAYKSVRNTYGAYSAYNENELFFFRNMDVPISLKEVTRPLIFPTAASLSPAITYLSSGYSLQHKSDLGAAINCYYAALMSSGKLQASPYERALLRSITFSQISKAHLELSNKRKETSALFELGAALNNAYLKSSQAVVERQKYYDDIEKIKGVCSSAEDKAREIRGTKRLGGFLAAVSAAGSIASTSPYDNTVSNAMMDQAQLTLQQYFDEASSASKVLDDQFRGIEDKIESQSFIADDGGQVEIGKPFVAGEVCYFLLTHPDLEKEILLQYASNKPNLKDQIQAFYDNTNPSDKKELISRIFQSFSELEAKVVNSEVRGYSVSDKMYAAF